MTDELKNLATFLEEDIPEPNSIESEYNCWIKKWKHSQGERPSTASASLQQCDGSLYPNIKTMFRLICTMPVTTSKVERTISQLKTIKTYPRSTQKEDRLNGLAMMIIHYEEDVNFIEVVDEFANKFRTKMTLKTSLLLLG